VACAAVELSRARATTSYRYYSIRTMTTIAHAIHTLLLDWLKHNLIVFAAPLPTLHAGLHTLSAEGATAFLLKVSRYVSEKVTFLK
jgi:hypothetical protein